MKFSLGRSSYTIKIDKCSSQGLIPSAGPVVTHLPLHKGHSLSSLTSYDMGQWGAGHMLQREESQGVKVTRVVLRERGM